MMMIVSKPALVTVIADYHHIIIAYWLYVGGGARLREQSPNDITYPDPLPMITKVPLEKSEEEESVPVLFANTKNPEYV
jgi:hypothetical protein